MAAPVLLARRPRHLPGIQTIVAIERVGVRQRSWPCRRCGRRAGNVVGVAAIFLLVFWPAHPIMTTSILAVERLAAFVLIGAAPLDLLVGPSCRIATAVIMPWTWTAFVELGTAPILLRPRPAALIRSQPSIAVEKNVWAATLHVLAAPIPLLVCPRTNRGVAVHGIVRCNRIWAVGRAASVSCLLWLTRNWCTAFVLVLAAPVLLFARPTRVKSTAVKTANIIASATVTPLVWAPGVLLPKVSAVEAALLLVLAAPGLLLIRPAIHPPDFTRITIEASPVLLLTAPFLPVHGPQRLPAVVILVTIIVVVHGFA